VSIELPPLRERRADIPAFVEHFLAEARARHPSSKVTGFSRDALARLLDHSWPGNVRELGHAIESCVLLADGPEVALAELPPAIRDDAADGTAQFRGDVIAMRELQRRYARWALDQVGGQKARAAEKLDVDIKTLNRWLASDDEP
jgi:two-component system response regulator HydG